MTSGRKLRQKEFQAEDGVHPSWVELPRHRAQLQAPFYRMSVAYAVGEEEVLDQQVSSDASPLTPQDCTQVQT